MAVIDNWSNHLFKKYGEKWLAKGECSLKSFLEFLKKGNKTVKMITGELDRDLYNRIDVIEEMKTLLENEVGLDIIFHKNDSKRESIIGLLYDNPRITELKKNYPDQLRLYWQKERADVHFAVVDKSHIFIEYPHEAYKPRGTFIKYKTEILGKRWDERFDDTKRGSEEITLEEILKSNASEYK